MQTLRIHSNIETVTINFKTKEDFLWKTFFGSTFIEKEKLEEVGINYPIKLEYYKQINEDVLNSKEKARYGIYMVMTEYIPNNFRVESKNIKYVTNDESEENRILNIFKESKVTIVNSEEVLSDLLGDTF